MDELQAVGIYYNQVCTRKYPNIAEIIKIIR